MKKKRTKKNWTTLSDMSVFAAAFCFDNSFLKQTLTFSFHLCTEFVELSEIVESLLSWDISGMKPSTWMLWKMFQQLDLLYVLRFFAIVSKVNNERSISFTLWQFCCELMDVFVSFFSLKSNRCQSVQRVTKITDTNNLLPLGGILFSSSSLFSCTGFNYR